MLVDPNPIRSTYLLRRSQPQLTILMHAPIKAAAVRSTLPWQRAVLLVLVLAAALLAIPRSRAASAPAIPPPAADEPASSAPTATAVFAGGCFWGVQAVFQHVNGVLNAVSGYAGGAASTAHYDEVGSGATGHAEAVQITYDPRRIRFGTLLQIYFSVAHDPTQLNRQGPDRGTQYRSAIFPVSDAQAQVAKAYIAQLDQAKVWGERIVTRIEPGKTFYPAEAYHQDFLARNPDHPYIRIHDQPKLVELQRVFPDAWKPQPALVSAYAAR